jgi:NADPH:quinone reductase-like Zn-dependent oxidoreductase
MQYLTAWGALVHFGKIRKGDFVIITAASSSVGIAAIEICKAEGAFSIATTRTPQKKAELLALGADAVIVTDEEDLVARVKEITGGKGARLIFDAVAGPGLAQLARAAKWGGKIFLYGGLSREPTPLPLLEVLGKSLTVKGYMLFEVVESEFRPQAEKYIYDHLAAGTFQPKIDRVFPLSEIVEAHRYMLSNEQIGKIVVKV